MAHQSGRNRRQGRGTVGKVVPEASVQVDVYETWTDNGTHPLRGPRRRSLTQRRNPVPLDAHPARTQGPPRGPYLRSLQDQH